MNYCKVLKEGETNEFLHRVQRYFLGSLKTSNRGLIMVDASTWRQTFICLRKIPCYFNDNSADLSGEYLRSCVTQKMKMFRKPGFCFHFCYFNNYQ